MLLIAGSAVRAAGQTASNDANGVKAIRFGRLVDGVGKAWKGAIVLVTGDRVSSVVTDPAQIPPGAEIIDLPVAWDEIELTRWLGRLETVQPCSSAGEGLKGITTFVKRFIKI